MKCPKCNHGWLRGTMCCDVCGTTLVEGPTGDAAIEQEKVCGRLRAILPTLGLGVGHEIEPGRFLLLHGSRPLNIQVLWLKPRLVVRTVAPLTVGSRVDEELWAFCREKTSQLHREALREAWLSDRRWPCWADFDFPGFPYGLFWVDSLGVVAFIHTLMASSLTPEALTTSIQQALAVAEQCDEEIVKGWGGHLVKKRPIENVLAPRVLELFRAAQKGP